MMNSRFLASRYQAAHNEMRNVDGLQPQEALDELLKYVFFRERDEISAHPVNLMADFASQAEIDIASTEIRRRFNDAVADSPIAPSRWRSEGILLSDLALIKIHSIFQGFRLTGFGLDLRSSALREFLTGPIRKGLGIFLTPDEVVREVVRAVDPKASDAILDPACGSGTFLMDAAQYVSTNAPAARVSVYGIDKNPRMIQLAEFNCAHLDRTEFRRAAADSLLPWGSATHPHWLTEASFDVVLTNPPFGVSMDERAYAFEQFLTCSDGKGGVVRKQGSEIVFLERAIQLLRPNGLLGIVLPRSVITNHRISEARQKLGKLGAVLAVVSLPPETFAATGTQTTTVVLIVKKYGSTFGPNTTVVPVLARVDNVGFDLTGRSCEGNQLPGLGDALANAMRTGEDCGLARVVYGVPANETFASLERTLSEGRTVSRGIHRKLGSLVALATTGATPPRSAYADAGLFLVKVGNLSGNGVNWAARDRNYVGKANLARYLKTDRLLRAGDIILTSSAHSSKYIAKKVDIITQIPDEVGGRASFVGEVMLVRPTAEVDPFLLLAYLRSGYVMQALQDRVRGQTAHLHPLDLLELPVEDDVYNSPTLAAVANVLRREAALNDELNGLAFEQVRLRRDLDEKTALIEMAAE